MAAERYRLADVEWIDVGDGGQAVSLPGGKPIAIPAKYAAIVASSKHYLTLEELGLNWARQAESAPLRQFSGWAPQGVQRWLLRNTAAMKPGDGELREANERVRELVAAGVLISDVSFVAAVQKHPVQQPAKISRVGLPTRKRPEALRRAIASYCENGQAFGRNFEFVIVDDSREEAAENETRALLTELQTEYGFALRFAGWAERSTFAEKLAQRAGVDAELARFAVLGDAAFPLTTGSVRNCLLLDCVDEPLLMGDDDGVCRTATWPDAQQRLAFSSLGDPTLFEFFGSREQTLAAAPFAEVDLLTAHESLLGRSVGEMLAGRNDPPELNTLKPRTEGKLRREGGRILATMAGVVGDSGIGSSAYLDINLESARQAAQSEEFYRAAVASRQVIRAARQATVGDFALCMSGNLAIDTRELPPLFTPVLRNSDGVFGRLLRQCHPGAYSGAIPYAVLHDPLEQRSYSLDAWKEDAAHIRYADVLLLLLDAWTPQQDTTEKAYVELAAYLMEQTASEATLQAELHRLVLLRSALTVERLRKVPHDGFPDFYQRLRNESADLTSTYAARPAYVAPRDLRELAGGEEDAVKKSRELTMRMAQLYAAWPRLWQAARELAQEGVRLTRPV